MNPRKQTWIKTRIQNLFCSGESATYYGRVKIRGRVIRKSLGTQCYNVARERLRDWLISLDVKRPSGGGRTLGAMIEPYLGWLSGQKILGKVADSTIRYKRELLDNIETTWPGFKTFILEDLTADGLRDWQVKHRTKYSATRTNGAITVLREMIRLAQTKGHLPKEAAEVALSGLQFVKVDYDYKRMTLSLPEPEKLVRLRDDVYRRCSDNGSLGAWLFDFLLFSGCRIESANEACWEDVKWDANGMGKLYFRKAKYGPYEIPLFPQLRDLLERIKKTKPGKPEDRILPTKSLQSVLTSACRSAGISHLSHHDLRHIFATRAIESGVDLPTVAAWLGHKDGGKTAMMIYGHLRQTHSQAQAMKMDFLKDA